MTKFCLVAASLFLADCASVLGPSPIRPTASEPAPAYCPATGSSDWTALVNAMPGSNSNPTLTVTGTLTFPSADWHARLIKSQVLESDPVIVVLDIEAAKGSSGAQIPTTRQMRGSWPSEQRVRSVWVRCYGRDLVHISPVETVY
jgi:hypothetical protein